MAHASTLDKHWLQERLGVSRETLERLDRYRQLVASENERQNLVAKSTLADFWRRHIADSAQLIPLIRGDRRERQWLDIGSGAGLPGIVIAIIIGAPIALVEPRTRRAAFLRSVVEELQLSNVEVHAHLEDLDDFVADVITARAVAPIDKLFTMAARFLIPDTIWLLPKGKSGESELAIARVQWQGGFAMADSITEAGSKIVVARGVARKAGR